MKYDGTNLSDVLKEHIAWLGNIAGGTRADFCWTDLHGADLRGANFRKANLKNANLNGANLVGADMREANIYGASFYGANLRAADFTKADLRMANLRVANLEGASFEEADMRATSLERTDLKDADFTKADLEGAYITEADFRGANIKKAKNVPFIPMVCPDTGAFIGWKKINGYLIVKLSIPAEAKRSSASTRKCRCEFADVLEIQNIDGQNANIQTVVNTNYAGCIYTVGQRVYPDFWDDCRWNECSHGIHFFINRQEAVEY